MKTSSITRGLALSALVAGSFAAPAQQALADDPIFVPAGLGCADFSIQLSSTGGNLHEKEFYDAEGNVVRTITAGKGFLLTYTNMGPDPDPEDAVAGESITFRTDGSVTEIVTNPDGTLTYTATGHNALIMFPTDVPAGPTTTQYVGRIVFNVDPATGVFTLVSTSGRAVDVCAELAD